MPLVLARMKQHDLQSRGIRDPACGALVQSSRAHHILVHALARLLTNVEELLDGMLEGALRLEVLAHDAHECVPQHDGRASRLRFLLLSSPTASGLDPPSLGSPTGAPHPPH